MISICFVHFKPLSIISLRAALTTVRKQNLSLVDELVIFDNDSGIDPEDTHKILDKLDFPISVHCRFARHGRPERTHAWSSNQAVLVAEHPWIFFTRSDYLLDLMALEKFAAVVASKPNDWDGFVTASGCHLPIAVEQCDIENLGQLRNIGAVYDYTHIDTGVWMARRDSFDRVGGLDERLSAWGHAQTHFQWKLYQAGVEFVKVPEVLFYHPAHGGEKDLSVAHQQLASIGVSVQELWARYDGPRIY